MFGQFSDKFLLRTTFGQRSARFSDIGRTRTGLFPKLAPLVHTYTVTRRMGSTASLVSTLNQSVVAQHHSIINGILRLANHSSPSAATHLGSFLRWMKWHRLLKLPEKGTTQFLPPPINHYGTSFTTAHIESDIFGFPFKGGS